MFNTFKNRLLPIAFVLFPIIWALSISAGVYQILQTVEITSQKVDEVIEQQTEYQSNYTLDIETFNSIGREIYSLNLYTYILPVALREYHQQSDNAFASCAAGEECLDSVKLTLYKDTPNGTTIVKDTCLYYEAR